MSSETNDNAAHQVFAVPELLENILLQVLQSGDVWFCGNTTIRTVLTSQRVDQTFRNTIVGSKKIQEGFWKLPLEPTSSEKPRDCINPFFLSVMNGHSPPFENVETDVEDDPDTPDGARKLYFQHPIICYLDRMSKNGVWKDMDLIRPNTKARQSIEVRIFENDEDAHDFDEFCQPVDLDCSVGITVAQVIEEVQKSVDERNALHHEDWEAIRPMNASRSQEDVEELQPLQTCLEWRMGR